MKSRCQSVGDDKLIEEYHDKEWGVPLHNDRKLFEFLILEGADGYKLDNNYFGGEKIIGKHLMTLIHPKLLFMMIKKLMNC